MMGLSTTVEEASLKNISDALGGISYKAPTILKNVANATGKATIKRMQEKMDKKYGITSDKINIKKSMRRVSATFANPRTIIETKSPIYSLGYFQVTPRKLAYGKNKPETYKGAVLRDALKKLVWKDDKGKDNKGFYIRFKNGHEDIAIRLPNSREVQTINAPSIPGMAGETYREGVEEETMELMKKNLQKEIDLFFKRRDKA